MGWGEVSGERIMYNECRHIMPSGKKCHAPALRNQPHCYYHQNLRRYGSAPNPEKLISFPIEDVRGIQISLTQVLGALNSPYMDTRRAGLLLYGLQIATQLAKQIPAIEPEEIVRTCEETDGVSLAPEKAVCEPSIDCHNCSRQHACENYEEPEEDADEQHQDELTTGDHDSSEEDGDSESDFEGEESKEEPKNDGAHDSDEEPGAKYRREQDLLMLKGALRLFRNSRTSSTNRFARSGPQPRDRSGKAPA
jgi:hypothetical protein